MTYEEWMKGSKDKPIETAEDALTILCAGGLCSETSCSRCAVHVYDHSDSNCSIRKANAKKKLIELCGEKGKELHKCVYDYLFHAKKEEAVNEKKAGTCAECFLSETHTSGIRYCKSFGNFVHEDGFCYRFVDAKLEKEADKLLVDNSEF